MAPRAAERAHGTERSRPPPRREGGGWREELRPTGTDDVQCRAARRPDGAGTAGRAVTVVYVAAPVPLLAVPLLAGAAGEAVDHPLLPPRAVTCREEGGGRAEEGGVRAGEGVAPGVLCARSGALWVKEEEEKEKEEEDSQNLFLLWPRSSSTTEVVCSWLVTLVQCFCSVPFVCRQASAARYGPE